MAAVPASTLADDQWITKGRIMSCIDLFIYVNLLRLLPHRMDCTTQLAAFSSGSKNIAWRRLGTTL